jgi:ribosomal protein S19E (S16A)
MKKTKRVLLPNNKKEDLGGRWARGRSEKRERRAGGSVDRIIFGQLDSVLGGQLG